VNLLSTGIFFNGEIVHFSTFESRKFAFLL
jgi:hypothetical protein